MVNDDMDSSVKETLDANNTEETQMSEKDIRDLDSSINQSENS